MKAALLAALLAAAPSGGMNFTATSVNVAEPGTPVRIQLVRWSSEEERAPVIRALSSPGGVPAIAAQNSNAAAAGRQAGGRGAAGRGRGRGRGDAAPLTPIAAFTAALGRAPTLGYIWTSDITGYAIKYAWHATLPDGTDRIVLASDRRLGAYTTAWKASTPTPDTDYAFTLIELRPGPKGMLEGRTSLTGKIAIDNSANTVALESWDSTPAIIQVAKR
jgi:hypothetical protein